MRKTYTLAAFLSMMVMFSTTYSADFSGSLESLAKKIAISNKTWKGKNIEALPGATFDMKLGLGFNALTGTWARNCFRAAAVGDAQKAKFVSGGSSDRFVLYVDEYESLRKKLSLSLYLTAEYGSFANAYSGQLNYSEIREQLLVSENFHGIVHFSRIAEKTSEFRESDIELPQDVKKGTLEFIRRCGTHYVRSVRLGGSLDATLTATSLSIKERNDFSLALGGKGSGATWSASGEGRMLGISEFAKTSNKVTFTLKNRGGYVTCGSEEANFAYLPTMQSIDKAVTVDKKIDAYVKCALALESVLAKAHSENSEGILAPISYELASYEALGLLDESKISSHLEYIQAAMFAYEQNGSAIRMMKGFLDSAEQFEPPLDPAEVTEANQKVSNFEKSISDLYVATKNCANEAFDKGSDAAMDCRKQEVKYPDLEALKSSMQQGRRPWISLRGVILGTPIPLGTIPKGFLGTVSLRGGFNMTAQTDVSGDLYGGICGTADNRWIGCKVIAQAQGEDIIEYPFELPFDWRMRRSPIIEAKNRDVVVVLQPYIADYGRWVASTRKYTCRKMNDSTKTYSFGPSAAIRLFTDKANLEKAYQKNPASLYGECELGSYD